MKRNTKLALGLIAATAIGGAIAIPVFAHGSDDFKGHGGQQSAGMMGGQDMMQMMQKMMSMHGGMMGQGMGGPGAMGAMLGNLDADGDGTVTADEARNGLTALLTKYDADGNGTLSLDEFETLHSAMIRERMVDGFQALDNDGNGQITGAEMIAPADRIERMQAMGAKKHGLANGETSGGDHNGMKNGGMKNGGMKNGGMMNGAGNGSMMENN